MTAARQVVSRAALPALALVAAVLTWPVASLHAPGDLDGSWKLALHVAAQDGLDWGGAVQFTWGPLGFLGQPRWAYPGTTAAAFACTLLTRVLLCGTVLVAARRRFGLAGATLGALLVGFLTRVDPPETLGTLAVVWCLLALGRDRDAPLPRGAVEAGAAFATFVLLMKFNSGLLAAGAVGVTALALAPRVLTAVRLAGGALVTLVAGWLATGNALADVPAWLRGSLEVARGYSAAMGVEKAPRWEYAAAAAVVVSLVAVTLLALRDQPALRRVAGLLVVAAALFLKLKHGFVRHDPAHAHELFTAAVLLPAGLLRGRRANLFAGGLAVACGAALVAVAGHLYSTADLRAPGRFVTQAGQVVLPARRAALDAEVRAAYRALRPVDPALVAAVADRPVHVDPWDVSVAWAYGLRWRPVPVFQSYSAYTPYLDDRNAAAIAAPDGPAVLLRRLPPPAIDGRVPTFDSPAYQVAVVCHFRMTAERAGWQLLERVPHRCGPERELGAVAAAAGEPVVVPAPRDDSSLVVARFELDLAPGAALRDLALKAPAVRIELDGTVRRLVGATAGRPHLLRASPADPNVPRGQFRDVRSIRLLPPATGWRVRFYEVPLRES